MRVIATGRHSGEDRAVMLAYLTDGPNLITMAMNGWGEGEPSWWLNLQAHPEAIAELRDRTITITARAATPAEHERHWEHYRTVTPKLDAYAANRSTATTMIVLEPVDAS